MVDERRDIEGWAEMRFFNVEWSGKVKESMVQSLFQSLLIMTVEINFCNVRFKPYNEFSSVKEFFRQRFGRYSPAVLREVIVRSTVNFVCL